LLLCLSSGDVKVRLSPGASPSSGSHHASWPPARHRVEPVIFNMDFIFSKNKRSKFTEDLPEPKRISTPAGLRLSTILENGDQAKGPSKLKRLSFNKQPVLVEDPNETSGAVEAGSLAPPPAQGYTYSIFSDKSATVVSGPIKPEPVDKDNFITRRGGWRRLALIVGLVLLVILALGVGLGVGLKHRHHSQ